MKRGAVGRADFLALRARLPWLEPAEVAAFLGLVFVPEEPEKPSPEPVVPQLGEMETTEPEQTPAPPPPFNPIESLPFWKATSFHLRSPAIGSDRPAPEARLAWSGRRPDRQITIPPLCRWRTLIVRLRGVLGDVGVAMEPDVPRAVQRIAEGRDLGELPRRRVRRWGARVQLVIDVSERLASYSPDQKDVRRRLCQLLGEANVGIASCNDPTRMWRFSRDRKLIDPDFALGSLALVLGDLGALQVGEGTLADRWLAWGEERAADGCVLVALVPCAADRIPAELRRLFRIVSWQEDALANVSDPDERLQAVERMLALLSPCIRIEPELLRTARCLLPQSADASLEAEFLQHPSIASTHSTAFTIRPEDAKVRWLPLFESEPTEHREHVFELVRELRSGLPDELMLEELSRLSREAHSLLSEGECADVARFIHHLEQSTAQSANEGSVAEYARRFLDRLPDSSALFWNPELQEVRDAVNRLDCALNPDREERFPGFDPNLVRGGMVETISLHQVGNELAFVPERNRPANGRLAVGSPLGTIRSSNGWITVTTESEERREDFWKSGKAPGWAADWGRDEFGPWATIRVPRWGGEPVEQRLRWIPPGTFLMGSPQNEKGRWLNEEPQHPVAITRGFWLFDTPVTQQLWSAVMPNNPSYFKGERRPVESVSWKDAEEFHGRLAAMLPDFRPTFPTEAQWEYACRARTQTRYSFGDDIDPGRACYQATQTVDVATFARNAFGLFDMHGNVLEWCLDGEREYSSSSNPLRDPVGERASRVVHGGSWNDFAQFVRSAFRIAYSPSSRGSNLGFRCALVQDVAEPAAQESGRRAEPKANTERTGQARKIFLKNRDRPKLPLPAAATVVVRSDMEDLHLQRVVTPSWASAAGRDRYGFWAEFVVKLPAHERTSNPWALLDFFRSKSVVQRMRWVPPGRVQVESPLVEPGRQKDDEAQHEVIINEGFWLFDTPCRQELWLAVMGGENPSRFKDPLRPVEMVSWDMTEEFLSRLQRRFDDFELRLPTEAQWEYACRAGTATATYAGPMVELGENHAPVLDAIAWYGGNSGVGFDLDNGIDSANWPIKQYDHRTAGTRKVGNKEPNAWGLYDMLGNVWEWCDSILTGYGGNRGSDAADSFQEGVHSIVRGGSWRSSTSLVQAACRGSRHRQIRDNNLGFRCALVQRSKERLGDVGRGTMIPSA